MSAPTVLYDGQAAGMDVYYLPPNHVGPVAFTTADPVRLAKLAELGIFRDWVPFANEYYPEPGPDLVEVEGGNTRQVVFRGRLYVAFLGAPEWTEADEAHAVALGYVFPPVRHFRFWRMGAEFKASARSPQELSLKSDLHGVIFGRLLASWVWLSGKAKERGAGKWGWQVEEIPAAEVPA